MGDLVSDAPLRHRDPASSSIIHDHLSLFLHSPHLSHESPLNHSTCPPIVPLPPPYLASLEPPVCSPRTASTVKTHLSCHHPTPRMDFALYTFLYDLELLRLRLYFQCTCLSFLSAILCITVVPVIQPRTRIHGGFLMTVRPTFRLNLREVTRASTRRDGAMGSSQLTIVREDLALRTLA